MTEPAKKNTTKVDKKGPWNSKDIWRKGGKGVIDLKNITEVKEPIKQAN